MGEKSESMNKDGASATGGSLPWRGWRGHALERDHVGEFEEGHARLEERSLEHAVLGIAHVALRLLRQDPEQVDGLTRTDDVDAALTFPLRSAHLDHGGEEELL